MIDPADIGQQRRRARRVGLLVGAALVAAAVWTIARSGGLGAQAWDHLRQSPPPLLLLALFAAVACIALCTALSLQWLTNRTNPPVRVQLREMLALVCAGTLGNFVPMQPGLVGRIAYQHQVNGVPVPVSVLVTIQSTVLTGLAAAWLAGALALAHAAELSWAAAVASPIALLPLMRGGLAQSFGPAFLVRAAEIDLWALRIHCSFQAIGQPIDPAAALALACAANAANIVPFIGNGIGVREWFVGFLAPIVAGVPLADALGAELLGRAAEIAFFVPAGLASWPLLQRRLRVRRSTRRVDADA
jgi:uncharacterized membrane protein YbhN (UPF0104 family)